MFDFLRRRKREVAAPRDDNPLNYFDQQIDYKKRQNDLRATASAALTDYLRTNVDALAARRITFQHTPDGERIECRRDGLKVEISVLSGGAIQVGQWHIMYPSDYANPRACAMAALAVAFAELAPVA